MAHILILGGGAAGLAAALAAAQAAPAARVTVLERNPKVGKKLLATGNGRCNLDNTAIAPEKYFTADPAALRPLLAAVDAAAPLAWFEQLGLYTRTDEAGRVYPYSNQAADVLALLELHLQRHTVQLRTGCTVSTLRQSKGGYAVQFANPEGDMESLRADAVICAMGGAAGPQFGTDGFGTRFAAACGGQMHPLYPCLTALQCAKPNKSLAGIRAKAAARLLDGDLVLAEEMGEVQFTDYGLSGICLPPGAARSTRRWSLISSPLCRRQSLPPCLRRVHRCLPRTRRRHSGWGFCTASLAAPSGLPPPCRILPPTPCPQAAGRSLPTPPSTGGSRGLPPAAGGRRRPPAAGLP